MGSTGEVMLIMAPIAGALVAIPTYFIARRFVDRFAALAAVVVLALLPGTFFSYSLVGFPDHSAAEVLFQSLAILAFLVAVAVAERVAGAGVAAAFYLAAYLFMNLGAFAVVGVLERHVGHDDVSAYRGLARRAPGLAAVLALALLSLAGVPPLAGFFGKVLLLQVGLDGGLAWLVVVAVLNMVVALYYYLTPIVRMYFGEHGSQRAEPFRRRPLYRGVIVLSLLGILVGGVAPELLMRVVSNVAELLTF
jgi:NADH:ubiquinone oxidoreductase subunit 2 (subunit N)